MEYYIIYGDNSEELHMTKLKYKQEVIDWLDIYGTSYNDIEVIKGTAVGIKAQTVFTLEEE